MLRLRLQAPFAVCRTFAAGWYRPTASFLTPSAAYGLLLNAAAIESRVYEHDPAHNGRVPASLTRADLPSMRIALGVPANAKLPTVQSVFQQLHNYPVGAQAGVPADMAMGNKNNISPVRREMLVGLNVVIAVDTDADLEDRIVRGLRGELNLGRYGVLFVGDNAFMPDRFEIDVKPAAVRWYRRVAANTTGGPTAGMTRLTLRIDRADLSRTTSDLFAPAEQDDATLDPPDNAWSEVGPDNPTRG
jgi:CRISPR-associated protein Cas5t